MKSITFVFAGVIALALIVGCKGTYPAKSDPNPLQEQEKHIMLDSKVKNNIKLVRELDPGRVPGGGQLVVGAVFVNAKSKDIWCDVKVQFVDSKGGILEETNWEPVLFQRSMEYTVKKNSLSPEAADYKISIRLKE